MSSEKCARPNRDELPPAPLGTILEVLMSTLGTSRIAVFAVSVGHVQCVYRLPGMESKIPDVWAARRSDLLGGDTVRAEDAIYLPLIKDRVVGVLEVFGVDERALDRFSNALLMCTLRMLPEALVCLEPTVSPGAQHAANAAVTQPAGAEQLEAGRVMRVALDELERRRLLALLDRHNWVVSAVARADGVDRVTIYRRMDKLGVQRPEPSPKAPRRGGAARRLRPRPACG